MVADREGDWCDLLANGEVEAAIIFPDHGKSARRSLACTFGDTRKGSITLGRRVALSGDRLAVRMLTDLEVVAARLLDGR